MNALNRYRYHRVWVVDRREGGHGTLTYITDTDRPDSAASMAEMAHDMTCGSDECDLLPPEGLEDVTDADMEGVIDLRPVSLSPFDGLSVKCPSCGSRYPFEDDELPDSWLCSDCRHEERADEYGHVIYRARIALRDAVTGDPGLDALPGSENHWGTLLTCEQADGIALALFLLGQDGDAARFLARHTEKKDGERCEQHQEIDGDNYGRTTFRAWKYLSSLNATKEKTHD